MPVGTWVMRTAVSTFCTFCPPCPPARNMSMSRSSGLMSISTSSASGNTATVAADVWIRPLDSVTGTRWTRCPPLSCFRRLYAPLPRSSKTISLIAPSPVWLMSITSVCQPLRWAYRVYMRYRSDANRPASSPPVPARISRITFFSSLGSFGISSIRRSDSMRSRSACNSASSSLARAIISASDSSRNRARTSSSWDCALRNSRESSTTVRIDACSLASACMCV